MRIVVDRSVCTGHGRCYALAPEVFDCDDDGFAVVADGIDGDLAERARLGAQACPEGAITVEDD